MIIDGHNRFRVIQDHPHISFTTYEKSFENRFAAIAWICKNQLGRRNLTAEQKKYLIGKQYESEKSVMGGDRKSAAARSMYQNDTLIPKENTGVRIARENNISRISVLRAEGYAKAVDAADEVEPGIRSDILSGKIKATSKDVEAIIHADPDDRAQLIANLRAPPKKEKQKREKKKDNAKDKAKIQEISEDLAKPRGKPTQSDMFYELDDSLNEMIFRWNTCLAANADHLADEACYTQVQRRVQTGLDYLNQLKNGEMPK